ncbi:hypothetical protein EVAR_9013_1 [Eumeta japonica]|uniref:Uncharacterized protein n=1 Tax=Eumeta variegata TaxID=151549 RepID=A0A4C1TVW3_EUMVA|nr:hypothetical protein EVAR_9013_1 [Eumeta japonica]
MTGAPSLVGFTFLPSFDAEPSVFGAQPAGHISEVTSFRRDGGNLINTYLHTRGNSFRFIYDGGHSARAAAD